MDSEVLEGAEEAALAGFPQPQLGGDAPVEPLDDAFAVGALGGRGEPEQLPRMKMLEQPPVRGGLPSVDTSKPAIDRHRKTGH